MAAACAPNSHFGRWILSCILALIVGSAGLGAACGGSGSPAASADATAPAPVALDAGSSAEMIVGTLVMDPSDPAALYAGMADGVYKWTEAAARWTRLSAPPGEAYRVHVEPFSSRLYAQYLTSDGYGLASSDDGGTTWTDLSAGAPKADVYLPDVWFWPLWGDAAVCMWGSLDGESGVYLQYDGDETWHLLRGRDREHALTLRGAWPRVSGASRRALDAFMARFDRRENVTIIDAASGAIVAASTGAPLVVPGRPDRFYLGTDNGVYRSVDGGRTWHRASAGLGGSAAAAGSSAAASPLPAPTVAGTLVFDRVVVPGTAFAEVRNYDIYLVRSDGTGLRQLTDGPGVEDHASWSPDGRRIVYGVVETDTLWVMDADGSHKHRLARGSGPHWSPDGRHIVCTRGDDIVVMNADGSGQRRVALGEGGNITPSWGPDGTIVFVREGALYAVNGDGSGLVRLRAGTDQGLVSPDGTTVAAYDAGNDRIIAFPFRGGPALTLLDRASDFITGGEQPMGAWTSDGRALVLGSSNCGEFRGSALYVVNADGSGLSQVPHGGDALSPAWRPE
jgi:hypothetical protein